MKPTLFVLAAGMGSRYGGLKQLDGLGPNGETIMDYSIFDAIRGGFGKVVFVIRKDFEEPKRKRRLRLINLLNRIHIGILEQNMVSLSCLAILLHSRRIKPMSDLSLEGLPVIRSIRG